MALHSGWHMSRPASAGNLYTSIVLLFFFMSLQMCNLYSRRELGWLSFGLICFAVRLMLYRTDFQKMLRHVLVGLLTRFMMLLSFDYLLFYLNLFIRLCRMRFASINLVGISR